MKNVSSSVLRRLGGNRKGTGEVRGWKINTHYCIDFPKTSGRSKFIVRGRVHAHDSKAVAGVTRVQKVDLIVDRIAINDLCHKSCCRCRDMTQTVNSKKGVDSTGCPIGPLLPGAFRGENQCPYPKADALYGRSRGGKERRVKNNGR